MKKIALVLAMLLCLVPVLSACGGAGGAEKVVKNYLEAVMKDFDKDAAYEALFFQNKDILKEVLDEEAFEEHTEEGWRDSTDKEIKSEKEYEKNADDYSFSYEIYDSRVIELDSDEYDAIIADYEEILTEDVEDAIEGMALVRVFYEQTYTKGDEDRTYVGSVTYLCAEIKGDWYIMTTASYSTHSEDSLTEWLD